MASKNGEGRVFIQRLQRDLMKILALEIVNSQQLESAPVKSKGKDIEASLKGHHLALVTSSHGLRCMVSVPGCLQYSTSLCQCPGILPGLRRKPMELQAHGESGRSIGNDESRLRPNRSLLNAEMLEDVTERGDQTTRSPLQILDLGMS